MAGIPFRGGPANRASPKSSGGSGDVETQTNDRAGVRGVTSVVNVDVEPLGAANGELVLLEGVQSRIRDLDGGRTTIAERRGLREITEDDADDLSADWVFAQFAIA
jgi:hypothetical protein